MKFLRNTARTVLIILSVFWFIFALLSGSEEHGGGLKGIMMNSPNAIPWLLLFLVVYVAFKWELIGGGLIATMGLITFFLFNAGTSRFVFFGITFPLIVLGGFLIASWYLTKYSK